MAMAGDLVALLAVWTDAAGVGHEDAGFDREVSADVSGVGEDVAGGAWRRVESVISYWHEVVSAFDISQGILVDSCSASR